MFVSIINDPIHKELITIAWTILRPNQTDRVFTKHTLNEGELTHVIEGIIYSTSMFISSFE